MISEFYFFFKKNNCMFLLKNKTKFVLLNFCKPGFLKLSAVDSWLGDCYWGGGSSCALWVFNSIPGLYQVDASFCFCPSPQVMTIRIVSRHCQMSPVRKRENSGSSELENSTPESQVTYREGSSLCVVLGYRGHWCM